MTDEKPNGKKAKSKRASKKKSASNTLKAHVTHLEMTSRLNKNFPAPSRPVMALMVARNIPIDFFNYIYTLVGKPHHWENPNKMDPAELHAMINDETCEIGILYADGCPAGFYELDLSNQRETVEIKCFGLAPDYQGLALGKWFLALTIQAAWAHKPEKVIVETNTLDHPAALRLYQQMGFSPFAVSDVEVEAWD